MTKKFYEIVINEFRDLPIAAIANLPGRLGLLARRAYWGKRLSFMGRGVRIGRNVSISSPENVSIGDNTWIDDNVTIIAGRSENRTHIHRLADHDPEREGILVIGPRVHVAVDVVLQAHGGLEIGEGVGIASGSKLYSLSHHYRNPAEPQDAAIYYFSPLVEKEKQMLVVGHVKIGRGSAIGLNAVVLPGAELAEYTWLGSGSVLVGKTPKGAIVCGNPAKVTKIRLGFEREAR